MMVGKMITQCNFTHGRFSQILEIDASLMGELIILLRGIIIGIKLNLVAIIFSIIIVGVIIVIITILIRGEGEGEKRLWEREEEYCYTRRISNSTTITDTGKIVIEINHVWQRQQWWWCQRQQRLTNIGGQDQQQNTLDPSIKFIGFIFPFIYSFLNINNNC